MKITVKKFLIVAIIITTLVEFYIPILGVLLFFLLFFVSSIWMGKEGTLILTGLILVCPTILYCCIGLRVIHKDLKTIQVVEPFFPFAGSVVAEGIRLDTVCLSACIEQDYHGSWKVKKSDYYVLSTADSSQILFDHLKAIMSGELHFQTFSTEYGAIDVVECINESGIQVMDLHGHDIQAKNYRAPIKEYKWEPDY